MKEVASLLKDLAVTEIAQITNEHLKQITIGTLISEQNPNELETIIQLKR
jgi:hypothetical protein